MGFILLLHVIPSEPKTQKGYGEHKAFNLNQIC